MYKITSSSLRSFAFSSLSDLSLSLSLSLCACDLVESQIRFLHPKKTAWDSLLCNALQLRIPTSLCLHHCTAQYVFVRLIASILQSVTVFSYIGNWESICCSLKKRLVLWGCANFEFG